MKITVTETLKRQLRSQRDNLQESLDEFLQCNRKLGGLEQRRRELNTKLSELESSDSDDQTAIHAIQDSRTALTLVENQLNAIPPLTGTEQEATLQQMLRAIGRTMELALQPAEEKRLAEISQKLRPYFTSDEQARGAAFLSGAVTSLKVIAHRRYGHFGVSVGEVNEALRSADEILTGDLSYEFNPQLKKP
jgi:septal ring factor EnvC (AmiA/AmiB activator)